MCHYHTLFYDDVKGYVIHCHGCNTIQVAFGNVLLTLYREDFYGFQQCINRMHEDHKDNLHCAKKFIVVPTPCDGMKLLLSGIELTHLQSMLDTAETEFQSLQLISLFDHTAH
jgi:hypothetical protein